MSERKSRLTRKSETARKAFVGAEDESTTTESPSRAPDQNVTEAAGWSEFEFEDRLTAGNNARRYKYRAYMRTAQRPRDRRQPPERASVEHQCALTLDCTWLTVPQPFDSTSATTVADATRAAARAGAASRHIPTRIEDVRVHEPFPVSPQPVFVSSKTDGDIEQLDGDTATPPEILGEKVTFTDAGSALLVGQPRDPDVTPAARFRTNPAPDTHRDSGALIGQEDVTEGVTDSATAVAEPTVINRSHARSQQRERRFWENAFSCDCGNTLAWHRKQDRAFERAKAMRADATSVESIVVAFDTEFVQAGQDRTVLSYQYCVLDPADTSRVISLVIVPVGSHRLRFSTGLTLLFKRAGLDRYQASRHVGKNGGLRAGHTRVPSGGVRRPAGLSHKEFKKWQSSVAIPITFLSHYGDADLTTFAKRADDIDVMTRVTKAGGGLISSKPAMISGVGDDHRFAYPFSVTFRDTITIAPAGMKGLKPIGEAIRVSKIQLPEGVISQMDKFRDRDLVGFLEYGNNDAVVTMEFAALMYGDNRTPPHTLGSSAVSKCKLVLKSHFLPYAHERGNADGGTLANRDFYPMYSGMKPMTPTRSEVDDSMHFQTDSEHDAGFHVPNKLEPLNTQAAQVQYLAAAAFLGGYNASEIIGAFGLVIDPLTSKPLPDQCTYDVDLAGAYLTAMSVIPDPDWTHPEGVIERAVYGGKELVLSDFRDEITLFVGDVSFEYPADESFPMLPGASDGSIMYVLKAQSALVTGVAVRHALLHGAKVFCNFGYFLRVLRDGNGEPSHSLRNGLREFAKDRLAAEREFGKGSIFEVTIKEKGNTIYGKLAQGISGKRAYDAFTQQYSEIGGSGITSALHAAVTTDIVRVALLEANRELHELGYAPISTTTDGLITTATLDIVRAIPLGGLAPVLKEARSYLVDDSTIWTLKHSQSDLINGSTRLNISLNTGDPADPSVLKGVLAKGGFKSPRELEKGSLEERTYIRDVYLQREGRVEFDYEASPSFEQLARTRNRKDYVRKSVTKRISYNFDQKRRVIRSTLRAQLVADSAGTLCEIVYFETAPWATIEDCELARSIATDRVLKTVSDYEQFHSEVDLRAAAIARGPNIKSARELLLSLLTTHRLASEDAGSEWFIPNLGREAGCVKKRLEWLSCWGLGEVSLNDWKNSRRQDRVSVRLNKEHPQAEHWRQRLRDHPLGDDPYIAVGSDRC